jgi:lipoprotein signal peptidase
MAERSYRRLFWALAVAGTALDQVGKYGVFAWLYNDGRVGSREIIPGAFRLVAHFSGEQDPGGWLAPLRSPGGRFLPDVNHGALFGQRPTEWLDWLFGLSLSNSNPWVDNLVFSVVSVIAAVAIVYWTLRRTTARDRVLCAALGLILAGTVGNLYDRLVFGGVRDFLYFYLINWPVFNIADSCLVCGAFLLLFQAFFSHSGVPKPSAEATALATSKG